MTLMLQAPKSEKILSHSTCPNANGKLDYFHKKCLEIFGISGFLETWNMQEELYEAICVFFSVTFSVVEFCNTVLL